MHNALPQRVAGARRFFVTARKAKRRITLRINTLRNGKKVLAVSIGVLRRRSGRARHLAVERLPKPAVLPAATTPIEHVVVIFPENISFDHYFGTYPHALNPPGEPQFNPCRGRRPSTV